ILGKNKQKVMMHRIELKENDILIAGSDGKDDLVIDGKMNEDENLILSLVEKSNGNLNSIFGFLKETGEVRDDLSLLKVEILKIQKESPKPSNSFENGF
ncbi:MAG: hypothetical protein KDK36_19630, partial [Leptospiraceae bacterium]|nr:hypothetical protein [Leptospiraceae bacterium]